MQGETVVDRSMVESMSPGEMAESIRTFTGEALAELAKRRERGYTAACADLSEELRVLTGEGDALETEIRGATERVEAAERLNRYERDQLIVAGKAAEAQETLAGLEEIRGELAKIEGRRGEIAERCRQIEGEKTAALRSGAETFRESCIALIRGSEASLAGILDTTRDTLNVLEMQTGAPLYHPADLTAGEKSAEWFVLNKAYRGRG